MNFEHGINAETSLLPPVESHLPWWHSMICSVWKEQQIINPKEKYVEKIMEIVASTFNIQYKRMDGSCAKLCEDTIDDFCHPSNAFGLEGLIKHNLWMDQHEKCSGQDSDALHYK